MNDQDRLPDDNELPDPIDQKPELNPAISPISAGIFGLIAIFFLYQIGGSVITLLIFGFDLENVDVNALRLITMAGQLLLILVPALIFSKLVYQDVTTVIRAKLPSIKEVLIFVLGLMIITPLLQEIIFIQNWVLDSLAENLVVFEKIKILLDELDKIVESTYSNILSAGNVFEMFLVVIVVAIVPALCEEVFFRGFIQKSFEIQLKPIWAILVTSLFFGIYHFNPFGLVALVILGLYFGYAAYKSESIVVPIVLHFLNNFVAVIAFFIFGNEDIEDLEVVAEFGIGEHVITMLVMAAVLGAFMYYLHNNYFRFQSKETLHDMP